MADIMIRFNLRPCIIKNYRQPGYSGDTPAWFHCWVTADDKPMALVELESGDCRFIKPKRIQFIDTKRVEDEYDISKRCPEDCSHDCYYPMGECNLCMPEEK